MQREREMNMFIIHACAFKSVLLRVILHLRAWLRDFRVRLDQQLVDQRQPANQDDERGTTWTIPDAKC